MVNAKPLGNMIIKLDLNNSGLTKGLAASKNAFNHNMKAMQAQMKVMSASGDKAGVLKAKYDGLGSVMQSNKAQIDKLTDSYNKSFDANGNATTATTKYANQINQAIARQAGFEKQLKATQVEFLTITSETYKAGEQFQVYGKKLDSIGGKMSSVGSAMTKGITLPLAAGAAAVTKAAVSWESDFAGVKKTNDELVDSTGKVVYSYKDLESGLRGLAKELPSTHSEIASVAEAAGQLGIKTQNVKSFTKTMIDLGESTNMSAETAATSLARFANITKMSQKDFGNLGSAIVDLGNNFATTESEITEMALRIAGAGEQVGMSKGDILGFATALSSVGVEAEAGGSAISKTMVQMQLAVEKGGNAFDELKGHAQDQGVAWETVVHAVRDGGKNLKAVAGQMGFTSSELKKMYKEANKSAGSLDNFANVAGITSQEFEKLFKKDPSKAIMKFIQGLSNAEKQGTSAIKMLDDMDIKEVRLRDSLLRAANASGVFEESIKTGNKAWKENTALTEEANKRYETTESKLKMLKNEVIDAAIDLGGPFVDALRDGVEAAKPTIKMLGDLAKKFSDADPKTQKMIIRLLAYAAAAGPVLSVTGKLTKGTGMLTTGFGALMKQLAKKNALDAVEKTMQVTFDSTTAAGAGLAGFGSNAAKAGVEASKGAAGVAGFTMKVTETGGAAATAAGAKGVGAFAGVMSGLSPIILGVAGVGGALAVGYGAWKLFGEEAWNSSQRVKQWGTDVGGETDKVLDKVQTNTQKASGQFGLMEQGFATNSDSMVTNFEKIGQTIEDNLVQRIDALDGLIKELPATVDAATKELLVKKKEETEKALVTIQENTERISEIKKVASERDTGISASEAKIVQDLAKESTRAYVDTLDISAKEKKKILSAMTGDVSKASKEEAKLWVQSLGEQRKAAEDHGKKLIEQKKKELDAAGLNPDGEIYKSQIKMWEKVNKTTIEGFDTQINTIAEKYPELTDEVSFASGRLINSMGEAGIAAMENNQKILDNASIMSHKIAENAEKNAKKIAWTADETNKVTEKSALFWNKLVFDEKTGEVKTNVREVIKEASADADKWNDIRLMVHDARLDSNAKLMIGEAALANNEWDSMSWKEKNIILKDDFSKTMYNALEDSGKWNELSIEQKTAFLYSNTPEAMAETMFNLGLWDQYQPQVKALKADNYDFLNTLQGSEEKLTHWATVPVETKEMLGDNYDLLQKIYGSEISFNRWKELPDDQKLLLADNADFLGKLMTSETSMNRWNQLPEQEKKILANNQDLLNKVFGSEKTYSAWQKLPDNVKSMLADNVDLKQKVNDGTIKLADYKKIEPHLKVLKADDQASGKIGKVSKDFDDFNKKPSIITKTLKFVGDFGKGVKEALGFEKGTNYHLGGPAIVNDQRGSLYEELVIPKGGTPFIPNGRNVLLPDLPKGSKVLRASRTKALIPKYANGIGEVAVEDPLIKSLIDAINELILTFRTMQPQSAESDTVGTMTEKSVIPTTQGSTGVASLTPNQLVEQGEQYSQIGSLWINNLMDGWNAIVPQYMQSESLFISDYLTQLQNQNNPNYLQGTAWNRNMMNGWNSLTGTFINLIRAFCNKAMTTLRSYNSPMYNSGRTWQQNNLNGWNSLYGAYISRVNQLGNDSINNLRSKNSGFYNAGRYLIQSLINGINSMGSPLTVSMNGVSNKMVSGVGKGVNGVISGVNHVMTQVDGKSLNKWTVPQYAQGTKGHPGGLAVVNDQKGQVYRELVQLPSGETFIPEGRDLMMNLPEGSKVLPARKTKKIIPHYQHGIGGDDMDDFDLDILDLVDDKKVYEKIINDRVKYAGINEPWLNMTKASVRKMIDQSYPFVKTKVDEFFTAGEFDGALTQGEGNFNNVYSYLVDVAKKVMSRFPGLVPTSGYRPGDQYHHGRHQAIDISGFPNGSPKYTAAANYAFTKFPKQVGYVITNGMVRDRIGFSGTGNSGSWVRWPAGDHFDHVHISGSMGAGDVYTAKSSGSKGNIKYNASGGAEQWRSLAIKALKMEGQYSTANLNAMLRQIQTESGGNPNAINLWDSNAQAGIPSKGLLQTIDPTFRAYARPGYNKSVYDPLSNMLASIRYAVSRYGSLTRAYRGVGYANGGLITKDGLYRAGEGNKPEMVLPLTKKTRAIELMGEALAFMSGNNKQPKTTQQNVSANNSNLEHKLDSVIELLQALLQKDNSVYIDGDKAEKRLSHIRNRNERAELRRVGLLT